MKSMKKIIWFTGQPGSGKTTLSNALQKRLKHTHPTISVISVDGDDLRDILVNKDYSENGRRLNIQTAINITKFLQSKGNLVIASLVSPYIDLRENLKKERETLEIFLYTDEKRGKENYFVKDYEMPSDNYLKLNTGKLNIEECVDEILSFYW
jgi:adenylylsulfate kinase-like enzyme